MLIDTHCQYKHIFAPRLRSKAQTPAFEYKKHYIPQLHTLINFVFEVIVILFRVQATFKQTVFPPGFPPARFYLRRVRVMIIVLFT